MPEGISICGEHGAYLEWAYGALETTARFEDLGRLQYCLDPTIFEIPL